MKRPKGVTNLPSNTQNYQLKKPFYTDNADIAVLNSNFDTIDEALTPLVSQTTAPPSNPPKSKLLDWLGWLANRIRAITGKSNWFDTPSTNLENCYNHIQNGSHANSTSSANGFMSSADKQKLDNAVSANIASRLIIRDSSGRAQVSNPVIGNDISNKSYVDGYAVPKGTASTMLAMLTAQNNTNYTTKQVRNIVIWSSGASPPDTGYGDIVLKTF